MWYQRATISIHGYHMIKLCSSIIKNFQRGRVIKATLNSPLFLYDMEKLPKTMWCVARFGTICTIRNTQHGAKVEPWPRDPEPRDQGPPSKFKSGTPRPPSKFKSGTVIIIFLHCLTYFVPNKYIYNMEIIFHE